MQVKLTTDYALRMLIYLALKNSVANSREIADHLEIPQKNVLSIGRKLKTASYVNIISGPYGGYIMKTAPEHIRIYDIFSLFEDIRIGYYPRKEKVYQNSINKMTDQLYCELQDMFEVKLKISTLADLISGTLV